MRSLIFMPYVVGGHAFHVEMAYIRTGSRSPLDKGDVFNQRRVGILPQTSPVHPANSDCIHLDAERTLCFAQDAA